jgi:maltodextrin utilization protein YvdJ
MAIIKLTKQNYKAISPTKAGWDNLRLESEEVILFNTNELIMVTTNGIGKAKIEYKRAMVSSFDCKETLEEVFELINNSKNN